MARCSDYACFNRSCVGEPIRPTCVSDVYVADRGAHAVSIAHALGNLFGLRYSFNKVNSL